MDALYGMLRVLGADKPEDPAELDKLLRGQTEKLKAMLAEREALKSKDPEIIRISALADQALKEGALEAARKFHEQAKARVEELSKTVDQAEADLKARRIEFAEVYEKSAETYALAFDFLKAADDYAKAYRAGRALGRRPRIGLQGRPKPALCSARPAFPATMPIFSQAIAAYEQALSFVSPRQIAEQMGAD